MTHRFDTEPLISHPKLEYDRPAQRALTSPARMPFQLWRARQDIEDFRPSSTAEGLFAGWEGPPGVTTTQGLIDYFSGSPPNELWRENVEVKLRAVELNLGRAPEARDALKSVAVEMLQLLDAAVRAAANNDARARIFSDFNQLLSEKAFLKRMLAATINDEAALAKTLELSHPNNNGFDKLVLGSFNGWKLRLNVWWPDTRK